MPRRIDWRYHRPGCESCKRTQEFLASRGIEDGTVRSAGSRPLVGEDALSVLEGIDELWVAKGRRTLRFDLTRERPSDEELLEMMLGRSGKLRAPVVRKGRRLVVGYHASILEEALGA